MTIRRSDTVITGEVAIYHCTSRCVRRAYLCGFDQLSGRSFEHRRGWLLERIRFLVKIFSVEVLSYALMSNHCHLMVRATWEKLSDEEVARRWLTLYPGTRKINDDGSLGPNPEAVKTLLQNKKRMKKLHTRISSLSWFMKSVNEYLALKSNREDECTGRFWEGRFKCQRLDDEASVLLCSAYIDLNPIRAKMAQTPEESLYTSVWERIQAHSAKKALSRLGSEALSPELRALQSRALSDGWLAPLDKRLDPARGFLSLSTEEYLSMLDWTGREMRAEKRGAIPSHLEPILTRLNIRAEKWVETTRQYGRLFYRVVGSVDSMLSSAKANRKGWLRGIGAARELFVQA